MDCPSNRIQTIVAHYSEKISGIYAPEEAQAIVWMLMGHYFSIRRIDISMNPQLRLSESEMLILHQACKKILQHVPVQYVTGKVDFLGLPLEVNPAVLIPRPETEQLVQIVLEQMPAHSCRIIDFCTGSGCIAIALKQHRPDCEVFACDISSEALEIAQRNAHINNVSINFFNYDVLTDNPENISVCDVIVSNPPYVCDSEKPLMHDNVLLYEPAEALFVDDNNPLLFYGIITRIGAQKLSSAGKIFFEINGCFGAEMISFLENHKFENIKLQQDFRGKDRFVIGCMGVK